jgi:diphthamide biosynthesis protein 7
MPPEVEGEAAPPHPPDQPPSSTTHATTTLPLHADCAAFCPHHPWAALLAAGGYQLDEATRTRAGLVQLYDTHGHSLRPAGPAWTGAGVLDVGWRPTTSSSRPTQAPPHLALALADGTVSLLGVDGRGSSGACEGWLEEEAAAVASGPLTLRPLAPALPVAAAPGGSALALALAWRDATTLAASTSAGELAVARVGEGGALSLVGEPWNAHALEAWCVAWGGGGGGGEAAAALSTPAAGLLLSGADDAALKGWDIREPPTTPSLTFSDARTHGAGVTAIAPSPAPGSHLIATGSYDEKARLWDARAPGKPLLMATLPTGGGVWRLRWHPRDGTLILAAGMHAGFSILRVVDGGLSVAERYPHQATLAYGADWCAAPPPRARPGASLVATASFYDNLVHLWEPVTQSSIGKL